MSFFSHFRRLALHSEFTDREWQLQNNKLIDLLTAMPAQLLDNFL